MREKPFSFSLILVLLNVLFCTLGSTQDYFIAPAIQISAETSRLTQTPQPPSVAITITAEVMAVSRLTPLSVQLFYRTDENTFQHVDMTPVSDTLWTAMIPASSVSEPYVEFYVRVDDGLTSATDPQFNAEDVPYRIQISAKNPDQNPPLVELSTQTARLVVPSHYEPMDTALPISAIVLFDVSERTNKVILFWRQYGQTEYFASEMILGASDTWHTTIPDSAVRSPQIEFFILASDNNAVTTSPASNPQDRPYVINISETSPNPRPPFVKLTDETFNVIDRYQPSNQEINISAYVVDDRGRQPHSVRCACRLYGAITYKHFTMQQESNDMWSGSIDANDVLKPGVQFFIVALFDDEIVYAPSTIDPNDTEKDNPYFISVFTFNQPPKIKRTAATTALSESEQFMYQPIQIEAIVTDKIFPFLDRVELYYRHANDLNFQHAVMRAQNDSLFYAPLNKSFVTPPGVEYYIYANDTDLESYAPDKLAYPDSLYFIPIGSTLYNEPPIIKRTAETMALSDTAQLYGEPLRIAVTIIDTVGNPLQSATLFYRYIDGSHFLEAPMVQSDSFWWQDIPSNVVINPRVEYYITATDGVADAFAAEGSPPEQFPFTIDVMTPNPHPVIRHEAVRSAVPDSTLRIVVQVIDTTKYVNLVTLKYWNDIESDSVKMRRIEFDSFFAEIPGAMVIPPAVSYQIFAWDNWGYSSKSNVYTVPVAQPGAVLPNPFTPNQDGFNDYVTFHVTGLLEEGGRVSIYNQRGRKVREIADSNQWDGRNDDGDDLPPGVYLYAVTVRGDVKLSGTLTLIR